MNCLEFERLLDDGVRDRLPAEALAHAHGCAACARSLARARSLEHALEAHFAADVPPPAGFVDRVMARVERGEARGVRWLALPSALPWWTRAALEPGVVLALATLALFTWRGGRWLAGVRVTWDLLAHVPRWVHDGLIAAGFGPVGDWTLRWLDSIAASSLAVQVGLALGVAPLLAVVAWLAWRAGEAAAGAT